MRLLDVRHYLPLPRYDLTFLQSSIIRRLFDDRCYPPLPRLIRRSFGRPSLPIFPSIPDSGDPTRGYLTPATCQGRRVSVIVPGPLSGSSLSTPRSHYHLRVTASRRRLLAVAQPLVGQVEPTHNVPASNLSWILLSAGLLLFASHLTVGNCMGYLGWLHGISCVCLIKPISCPSPWDERKKAFVPSDPTTNRST